MNEQPRRKFLKSLFVSAGSLAMMTPLTKSLAAQCRTTPPQTEGPFYPEGPISNVTDLTRIEGRSGRAKGNVVVLQGLVQDESCNPLPNALVEIWQASESGRYQHSKDPNPAALDPNFRYWAEALTDANGEYQFRTIIPGAYPASDDWFRPPHIHFKVTCLGYVDLITQMYFAGQSLNDHDYILQAIPESERNSVIVNFDQEIPGDVDLAKLGKFAITLRKIKRP